MFIKKIILNFFNPLPQTPKTTTLAAVGVSPSQPKQSSGAVFGDVAAQTNGASQENKEPFGFFFTKPQEPQQQASNPSQNLFFQCMSQTQPQSPGISQGQSKDTNYFTALTKNVSKEPPTLFKPAAAPDGLKKAVVASASAGLFGSAPAGGLASIKEQPKVPDVKPAGNGILMNKSFGAGGETLAKLAHGFPPAVSSSPPMGSGDISKGLVTSAGLGPAALASPGAGMRNATSVGPASGFGLLSGSKGSEPHENLFLAASQEANPFLAYSGAVSNSPFSGLTTPKLSSTVPLTQPAGVTSILSQDPPATNSQSNLFTMAEPPKGILSSQFAGCSSSSSPAPFMSQQKDEQVLKHNKETTNGRTGSVVNTESVFAEGQAAPILFDQASQKFSLDERGQSSKRDSDSSTNSDLSDLSEAEDGADQTQKPLGSTDNSEVHKTKAQAAKNRPRSKPIKGSIRDSLGFSITCSFVNICMVHLFIIHVFQRRTK